MDDLSRYNSKPGIVTCMRCQKLFKSPDKLRIRRCPACKKQDNRDSPLSHVPYKSPPDMEETP
jgi:hypothetical protein